MSVAEVRDKIMLGRVHSMQHLLQALRAVRRTENKEFRAKRGHILVRTKYLGLRFQENLRANALDDFSVLHS